MDTFETKPAAETGIVQLQERLDALNHLVVSVLILLLVVSGTLSIYLLRQVRHARRELNGFRPQARQVIENYQKAESQAMQAFVGKLTEYGRTHPDFAPILAKYNLKPAAATSAAPPAAAPAPGAAPASTTVPAKK